MNKKMFAAVALVMCLLAAALCPVFANDANAANVGDHPVTDALCFTSEEKGSSVSYTYGGENEDTTTFSYSKDGKEWIDNWDGTGQDLDVGETLFVRNTANTLSDKSKTFTFSITGKVIASGDLTSMINYATPTETCFLDLFKSCEGLTEANFVLPDTTAEGCYTYMFSDCTKLTKAPELPATVLAKSCYSNMFNNCTSLTTAPELPATVLAEFCYNNMFQGCDALTKAPELPATELVSSCYLSMFSGCESLETAPILPAKTLVTNCYKSMFAGTKIAELKCCAEEGIAPTLENAVFYDGWLEGVTVKGTFYHVKGIEGWDDTEFPDAWDDKEEYVVKLNNNDGTGAFKTVMTDGEKLQKPEDPTREHYTFKEWVDKDKKSVSWPLTVTENDTEIYAQWTENEKCTIEFDIDGGTGSAPRKITDYIGEKAILPDYKGKKDGVDFKGWFSPIDNKIHEPKSEIVLEQDATFLAVYKNTFLVTFNTDGGSDAPKSILCDKDKEFTIPDYTGTRDGFSFGGWSYGDKIWQKGENVQMPGEDITLKAVWNENKTDNTVMFVCIAVGVVAAVAIIGGAIYYFRFRK